MKLLKKYSKEIDEKTKKSLEEIYNAIKNTDSEIFELLVEACYKKSFSKSFDTKKELSRIKEEESETAVNLIYSLCQNTEVGFIIASVSAILNKYSEETFEYINNSFDFKEMEKLIGTKPSKFMKNKSAEEHEIIDNVISVIKEKEKEYNIKQSKLYYLLKSKYNWISYALTNEFKKKENKLNEIGILLSILIEPSKFKKIRKYLGIKELKLDELENISYQENLINELKNSEYYILQEKNLETVAKLIEIMTKEESFVLSFLNEKPLASVGVVLNILKHKSIEKHYCSYFKIHNSVLESISLNDDDWKYVTQSFSGKRPVVIRDDTSYDGMRRSNMMTKTRIAELNNNTYESLKCWVENYNDFNIIGRLEKLQFKNNSYSYNSCYAIINSLKLDDDNKLCIEYIIADLFNDAFTKKEIRCNIKNLTLLSKFEATLFYNDVQQIEIRNRINNVNQSLHDKIENRYR